jgi:hypothetical protein
MTNAGKIKVIDKDISDFSVDKLKGEIKIVGLDYDNILRKRLLDKVIKGHEIDKSR